MKEIKIPVTFEVEVNDRKIKLDFKRWLQDALDMNPELCSGGKNLRKAIFLSRRIEKSNGTLKLEDADYETLKSSVENAKFVGPLVRFLEPFLDALDNAEEVKA